MSELILEVYDVKNIVEIETSIGNVLNNLDIQTNNGPTIGIEASINNVFNNLDIETSSDKTIEVINSFSLGVISASDIIGLNNYLGNFIDSYEIDCGSP